MRSIRFKRILPAILLLLCLAGAASLALAEETATLIDSVEFRRGQGVLLVDFNVKNVVAAKMVETLDSGLPVRFVYHVRFVRRAGALTSGVITDIKFERVIEKDNLKNRYRITEKDDTSEVADFAAAIEALSAVRNLEVTPLSGLLAENRYQVEIQVKLEEFRLPFHLHRILPFLSMWDVTTPWKTVRVPNDFMARP